MRTGALGLFLALAAAPAVAQITVTDAWARATVPGQAVGGAYLKIRSARDAYLIGASSPAAKTVEVHEMKMENGMMQMRPVARIELPAGKSVELKPGGYHVMLIDLVHPLAKGETIPLTLEVRGADGKDQKVRVQAVVRDVMSMGAEHGKK